MIVIAKRGSATRDLFAALPGNGMERLNEGAFVLRGFATPEISKLLAGVRRVAAAAPFRHMATPGGRTMSVAMTNCGSAGWVTDRRGYRYDGIDPETHRPWPPMPPGLAAL